MVCLLLWMYKGNAAFGLSHLFLKECRSPSGPTETEVKNYLRHTVYN